ncbi:MAG: hypothetical protein Q9191_004321 [Dirinaria sp. TL-2023a]
MLLLGLLCAGYALAYNLAPGHNLAYRDVSGNTLSLAPTATSTPSPSQQPNFTVDELYALQKKLLDNFIYPANAKQARAINSSLLAQDVQGRVDVTRTFNGRELNTEYLFGLFANLADNPGQISLLGVPLSYEIQHFAATQNIVSASTKFMFNFTALNVILPIRIDSWNTYNSRGEITQYDASFIWWDWAVATLIEAAAPVLGAKTPEAAEATLTQLLAKSICQTSTRYCNGTNTQYASDSACLDYLTKKVRFGQPYELGGLDTRSFRYPAPSILPKAALHLPYPLLPQSSHSTAESPRENMVPLRPTVHCPHIGPTGGGYCADDLSYAETVTRDYFTNAPYIPFDLGGTGNVSTPKASARS